MKPRIFIGSSSEGLSVATEVKNYLSKDFECYLWTDNIFKYNDNFLETLMKEASLFDFGLMVFTKDDYTTSRLKNFETARDNVLFEYGLFLGRIGRDRAYIIKDDEVKIPSDLFGVTLPEFKCVKESDGTLTLDIDSLHETLKLLKLQIEEKVNLGILGMLPSTVLAIGYFYNFIQPVCDYLGGGNEIEVEGKKFAKAKFKIVLPLNLDSDLKKKAKIFYKKNLFQALEIETPHRAYPLFVAVNEADDNLTLSDMPTTLNGIEKAIEMYLRVGHIGKTNEQKLLEERELRNFELVLRKLIENDAYCYEFIEIEIEK